MVNKMPWKKVLAIFTIILTLISIVIYNCISIYSIDLFFSSSPSYPKAFFDKPPGICIYDPQRQVFRCAPVALDDKEHIYIAGRKDGKVRIVLLNHYGKVERIIIPRLKNGHFLKWCHSFSVSPSGNHIWTIELEKNGVHRVTVHDRNGRAKMDWVINGYASVELLVDAYSEQNAYILAAGHIYHFDIRQRNYQKLKIPENFRFFSLTFLRDGKYWSIEKLDWLIQRIEEKHEEQITKHEYKEEWFGIATWSPQEGIRLVAKLKLPGKFGKHMNIHWIDKEGNFYAHHAHWMEKPSDFYAIYGPPLSLLLQILEKIAHLLNISISWKPRAIQILWRFSPEGEIMDKIILPFVIRPTRGEKLEYGQLIKADETGIYLEVERLSEPREYRIVKIVKKKRWQVWWEKLMKMVGR